MDNKITKERIFNHFEYDFYKYILLIAAVVVVIVFGFKQINADRDEEDISIFFSAYTMTTNSYEATTLNKMKSAEYDKSAFGEPLIRTLILDFVSLKDETYNTLFSTRGMISSDVIICEKNSFKYEDDVYELSTMLELNDNILSLLGINEADYEFLRLDENKKEVENGGKRYGIRIDNTKRIKNLATFSDGETSVSVYIFIFANKSNVGKDGNFQTLFCLNEFLKAYGN